MLDFRENGDNRFSATIIAKNALFSRLICRDYDIAFYYFRLYVNSELEHKRASCIE